MNWNLAKELKQCDDSGETCNRGVWEKEYLSNKHHDCSHCYREICPSEFYMRTAILVRPKGNNKRGTVEVFKKCKEHY